MSESKYTSLVSYCHWAGLVVVAVTTALLSTQASVSLFTKCRLTAPEAAKFSADDLALMRVVKPSRNDWLPMLYRLEYTLKGSSHSIGKPSVKNSGMSVLALMATCDPDKVALAPTLAVVVKLCRP